MTSKDLEGLGLTPQQTTKILELVKLDNIRNTDNRSVRNIYLTYYKEISLKKSVEELRLKRYVFEHDEISDLDIKRKAESETRLRMQNFFLSKIKELKFEFTKAMDNYAKTFNDRELFIFVNLYLKGMTPKEVAEKCGLAIKTVRNIKHDIDNELDEIFVDDSSVI